ncbi:hypothetical protein LOAG_15732, partial [Loa loa]
TDRYTHTQTGTHTGTRTQTGTRTGIHTQTHTHMDRPINILIMKIEEKGDVKKRCKQKYRLYKYL